MTCLPNRVQVFTIFVGLQVYEDDTGRNKSKMSTTILNGNLNLRCTILDFALQGNSFMEEI